MSKQVDVSVNIRGNTTGLNQQGTGGGNAPTSVPSTATPTSAAFTPLSAPNASDYTRGTTSGYNLDSVLPNQDRLIGDVRREMAARGVVMVPGSNQVSQIIHQVGQSAKDASQRKLDDDFDRRRGDLADRRGKAYDAVDDYIDNLRAQRIAADPDRYQNEEEMSALEMWLEGQRDNYYKKIGREFDKEEESIDERQGQAKNEAETALTAAIRELTQYFERQTEAGVNANSYLNGLRNEREALIFQRDNASTKEEAIEASQRLNEVEDKIREAEGKGKRNKAEEDDGQDTFYDPIAAIARGGNAFMMSMARGNLGGMIGGAGQAAIGASGMNRKNAAKAGLVMEIIKGIVEITQMDSKVADELGPMASWMAASGGSTDIRQNLLSLTSSEALKKGDDWGLDRQEYAARAVSTARARGISKDWDTETAKQIGLEKAFGLEDGALLSASSFDRYGMNVTNALQSLVSVLSGIKGSGVSDGDFTRVNEKLLIQQSVMETYKGISDRPDYNMANKMVAAFSASGVQQDDRLSKDINVFQDMIRNPVNDKAEAIINDVIAKMFPETNGRLDLIDRYKQDPQKEGQIMQAVMSRIKDWYGGTDTMQGYFAMKDITRGMISPDRIDKYQKSFTDGGEGGKILKAKSFDYSSEETIKTLMDRSIGSVSEMTRNMTKAKNEIIEAIGTMTNSLTGGFDAIKNFLNFQQ